MSNTSWGLPQKKHEIAVRFRNINMLLLILILTVVTVAVGLIVMNVTEEASKNYARFYAAETVEKLSSYFNKELALVRKVSCSRVVSSWFADEINQSKKISAYNEMMDYADMLQNANLYFGINGSLNEYSVKSGAAYKDFSPFDMLDPAIAYNSWYFDCLDSKNDYTLNIDIDKVSQTQLLWINYKTVHNGEIVGVFCSGLPCAEIIEDLFGKYDDNNVRGLVIDKNGLIQMDSSLAASQQAEEESKRDIREISADSVFTMSVDKYLKDIDGLFGMDVEPEVIRLSSGPYGYMSIAPIADTDWSVITFFNSNSLFSVTRLLPLLIAVLSAFVLYSVAGNTLIRRLVLTPLSSLTDSVSAASVDNSNIYGSERDDEFGELALTIQNMRGRLNNYNAEIMASSKERDRQGRLLHAANSAAAVLLAADESRFEASLKEGMELMARCVDVDRVYIWQNEFKNGVLHYVPKFEWLSSAEQKSSLARSREGFSYHESIPEWEEKFLKEECVNGPLVSLSSNEQKRLEPFGILSLLVIPVYLQDAFWGFVSFDDCHQERTFTEDEVNILRSGSLMMSSAMNRNETAAKMREADERIKLMLDATPLCCNLWNKELKNIDCNEEAVKLFELHSKQEYLDRFFELSPEYQPDGQLSAEKAGKYIEEAFAKGRAVFEWMHKKLDGTPVPSEITLVRVKHGDDYIVAGYTRDLREYKKMMADIERKDTLMHTVNMVATILLQSEIEEFHHNMWQCMGMLADVLNFDRVRIWKNDVKNGMLYCTQLYEWSEGAEPQQDEKYVVNIPYSETIPGWEEKLSGGQCINAMVRNMSPAEQAQLVPQGVLSLLVAPVFLQDQFWGFVGFDDCHSERVFSDNEESILRSGSLLIANALLRNEMTLNIRTAVEEAQSASRAKSNFLSNMSHEMRTPMNAIIGMTTIGKSAADVERKDYAFGKIEDASNHLLGVINDVLDMSKIEANKFDLSDVEFSFEKLLQKVVNVISFRVDEKRQHFSVYLDKDIPQTLIGDDQRLTQVITNLLANAIKFTPEQGTIRLSTQFVKEEEGLCTIQIDVSDTGIGISAQQQERLFTSFEQAESTITRKFGGTGLGLAISKRIVDLMGGRIWIESELGQGSTFSFTVQFRRGKEQSRSLLNPGVNWSNIRVLAVDDELETREYFASIAEQYKIACDTAGGGQEALSLIESKGIYDIYFVDWNMPGMNGIELSRKIKQHTADKSVVIMISATAWSEIENEAKAAGVDVFLPKPLFPSAIVDCVNRCIGKEDKMVTMDAQPGQSESFANYSLLLAEDVEINREIVLAMLEPTGLAIDCAGNGAEAVRMFAAAPKRYDMIFMDVQMPEMDGLEATRQIRTLNFAEAARIPIVAMTANVFREDIETCMTAGMNDHVGKPLDFEEVLSKLRQYLLQKKPQNHRLPQTD